MFAEEVPECPATLYGVPIHQDLPPDYWNQFSSEAETDHQNGIRLVQCNYSDMQSGVSYGAVIVMGWVVSGSSEETINTFCDGEDNMVQANIAQLQQLNDEYYFQVDTGILLDYAGSTFVSTSIIDSDQNYDASETKKFFETADSAALNYLKSLRDSNLIAPCPSLDDVFETIIDLPGDIPGDTVIDNETKTLISSIPKGEFDTINVDGKIIGVFVDTTGKREYTTDGKHFYDTRKESLKPGIVNYVKNTWKDFTDIFSFKIDRGLSPVPPLVKDVSSDVYDSFMENNDKTKKAYEAYVKLVEKTGIKGVSVISNSIPHLLDNGKKENFSKALEQYIIEREEAKSVENIVNQFNSDNSLTSDYLSQNPVMRDLNSSAHIPLLEEAYQKYKLAQALGRTK